MEESVAAFKNSIKEKFLELKNKITYFWVKLFRTVKHG